jgi:hypothetical protein
VDGPRPLLAPPGGPALSPSGTHPEGGILQSERAVSKNWGHYSTDQLERLLERLHQENGIPLPSVLAEIRAEIERRHAADDRI